jgi:hypothetical protein
MQTWYKSGYLPLDLPVRRENENDTDYITLQQLRLQSVDPNHPFRPAWVTSPELFSAEENPVTVNYMQSDKALLPPISLLAQPTHFGPPALFFSSRGGHSTSIIDNKGKSVLKGRFVWTSDDEDHAASGKLGDVKRIEAFNIQNRAILVALRQGGLEAVDIGNALMLPGDESRTLLPEFKVSDDAVGRRGTDVWRVGTPITVPAGASIPAALTMVRKKHSSTLPVKSPLRGDYSVGLDEPDPHPQEDILFLGRNEDNVYFCERNATNFRILRLSPISS